MIYSEWTKKAMKLAYDAHNGQVDKSGLPYIFHPYQVAQQMTSETSTIVALLHDVLEDTQLTLENLESEGFSKEVLDAISTLTRKKDEDYFDYIERVKKNPIAAEVKLADLAHNMDLSRLEKATKWDKERKKKYEEAIRRLAE